MTRAIGIPASLAILVIAPFLIAGAPKTKEPPAPVESALTVQADDATMFVKVHAAGNQPRPEAVATLASEDGLKTATVKAKDAKCGEAPTRKVALGAEASTDWCLQLTGLPDHGEVTGNITGAGGATATEPATKLTLTVRRRHSFCGLPLLALAGSLLLGLLLALFSPFLTRHVGLTRLGLLMARNEIAPVDEKISGLQDWVTTREAAGDSASTLREQLQKLLKNGPKEAKNARGELRAALKDDALGAKHPLARAADKEAKRIGHRIGDFVDGQGEPAVHPATQFALAVASMVDLKADIDAAEIDMNEWLKEECRPTDKLSGARLAWKRVATAQDVHDVDAPYQHLRAAIDEALGKPECAQPGAEGAAGAGAARSFKGLAAGVALTLGKTGLVTLLLGVWGLMTLGAIVVSLAFAGLTVAVASYDANNTFGSWQDYFGLVAAGLASGAAATVLGLLAPWRSTAAAPEAETG